MSASSHTQSAAFRVPNRSGTSRRGPSHPLRIAALLLILNTGADTGPFNALAGGVVTSPTETALRAALAGGGRVTFACDGEIALSQSLDFLQDTALDASGRSISISGSNSVRVLFVHSNVAVSLTGLEIKAGVSSNGAAAFVQGGRLTLSNVWFSGNVATNTVRSAPNAVSGGALFNLNGTIDAVGCTFISNRVIQTTGDNALCSGGAIYNSSGFLSLRSCTLRHNSVLIAQAYPLAFPAFGAASAGGAIYNSGTLTVSASNFASNSVAGGLGYQVIWWPGGPSREGPGGLGAGGAIYNSGQFTLSGSALFGNSAAGGPGQTGVNASFSPVDGSPMGPMAGGLGGSAQGAALYNSGTGALVNCTVVANTSLGGAGGSGGNGTQYYAHGVLLTIDGAWGGDGGPALGAIFSSTNTGAGLSLTNCTIADNTATGGPGGPGGVMLVQAPGGTNGPAQGGLCISDNCTRIVNTILSFNAPGNASGSLLDLGHNLSSDLTGALTNGSSLRGLNPALGPLALNGGTTFCLALQAGSPAVDAGTTASAPALDQRGLPRPVGLAADIGAYEFGAPAYLQISRSTPLNLQIRAIGVPLRTFEVQTSSNLSNWISALTNEFGTDGTATFNYSPPFPPANFFRLLPQ